MDGGSEVTLPQKRPRGWFNGKPTTATEILYSKLVDAVSRRLKMKLQEMQFERPEEDLERVTEEEGEQSEDKEDDDDEKPLSTRICRVKEHAKMIHAKPEMALHFLTMRLLSYRCGSASSGIPSDRRMLLGSCNGQGTETSRLLLNMRWQM